MFHTAIKIISLIFGTCFSIITYLSGVHIAYFLFCIISPSVTCLAVPFTLSHTWNDFRKENILNIKCAFHFLYKVCLKYFSF